MLLVQLMTTGLDFAQHPVTSWVVTVSTQDKHAGGTLVVWCYFHLFSAPLTLCKELDWAAQPKWGKVHNFSYYFTKKKKRSLANMDWKFTVHDCILYLGLLNKGGGRNSLG